MLRQQAEHMKQALKASQQRFEQDRDRLEKETLEKEHRRQMIQKLRDEDAAKQACKTAELQALRNAAFQSGFQRMVEAEHR